MRWGFESLDEMGSIDLYVIPAGDRHQAAIHMKTLKRTYSDHIVWTAANHVLGPDKLAGFGELREKAISRFDLNEDQFLSFAEREKARASLKALLP